MDCSKGTELGGNQFIGFPAKTSVVKWDHKKSSQRKRLQKLPQKRRSNRIDSRHQVFLWWKKHKKSLRNLTHMTQSWLRMKNQQNKEKSQLAQVLSTCQPGARLCVLFGPEGGFAPQEIEQFLQAGAKLCGLGPRILRAETAPLYLLSVVSYQMELLN